MKRLTIILILLILIPLSVEALYVKDEQGNSKNCVDKSKQEWHKYVIKYDVKEHFNLEGTAENSYYVGEEEGYPKPMYIEKGISQYGYDKDYTSDEYSTKFNKYREQHRLTEPEGKHLYTRFMSWVPFNLNDAAFNMAYQQFIYEYFVPDDECIPCTEKGLTEYYGECITCAEWSENYPVFGYDPDQVVQGKKGYYGCFPCPDDTKWDGKQCSDPTKEPPTVTPSPTTTVPPTTTPAPTTTVPPTTTPTPKEPIKCQEGTELVNGECIKIIQSGVPKPTVPTTTPPPRCPEHMKLEGIHCVERCPSTSLDDYRAWDSDLKKCVDPGAIKTVPPDDDKNYCGPEGKESVANKNLLSQASFNEGCYFHDNCDDACGEKKLTQSYCDREIKRIMDES